MGYKQKTFIGNRYSLKKLLEFRDLVVRYFQNLSNDSPNSPLNRNFIDPFGMEGILFESNEAKNIRTEINKYFYIIEKIMLDANINPSVIYYSQIENCHKTISLLGNIFILKEYNMESDRLIDFIDRAIGVYSFDKIHSIIRTFNPLFWFIRFLDFVINIPFNFLKKSGFDTQKIEENFTVRAIKFIFYCISSVASILTALNLLGYLEKII